MRSDIYRPIHMLWNDEPHVGTTLRLVNKGKLFLWIWLACACRSRGSWILVSVGSLCVVLQAVEKLGRVNTGGWHAWTSNFSNSNLFKLTNTDFVIYTLFTLNNTGPPRTFFLTSGQRRRHNRLLSDVQSEKQSRGDSSCSCDHHTFKGAHCGLSLSCARFLTR